jgi:hypothetical protein
MLIVQLVLLTLLVLGLQTLEDWGKLWVVGWGLRVVLGRFGCASPALRRAFPGSSLVSRMILLGPVSPILLVILVL